MQTFILMFWTNPKRHERLIRNALHLGQQRSSRGGQGESDVDCLAGRIRGTAFIKGQSTAPLYYF